MSPVQLSAVSPPYSKHHSKSFSKTLAVLLLLFICTITNPIFTSAASAATTNAAVDNSVTIRILEPTSKTTWRINKDDEVTVIFVYEKQPATGNMPPKTFNINLNENNRIILKLASVTSGLLESKGGKIIATLSYKGKFTGDKYDEIYQQDNKQRFQIKIFSDDGVGESETFAVDGTYEWTGYNYLVILGYASIPIMCGVVGLMGGVLMLRKFSAGTSIADTSVKAEVNVAPELTPYSIANPESAQENGEPTPTQTPVIELPANAYLKLTSQPRSSEVMEEEDDEEKTSHDQEEMAEDEEESIGIERTMLNQPNTGNSAQDRRKLLDRLQRQMKLKRPSNKKSRKQRKQRLNSDEEDD